MKKLIISFFLALVTMGSFAQKNAFEKYSDMEGVTSVLITQNMLNLFSGNESMDFGGVKVGDFVNKLSSILILTSENKKTASEMLSLVNKQVSGKDYELLMRVKSEKKENVNFFMKGKPESIRELIMVVDGGDGESVIMQFLGNFTLKDVQQMTSGIKKK